MNMFEIYADNIVVISFQKYTMLLSPRRNCICNFGLYIYVWRRLCQEHGSSVGKGFLCQIFPSIRCMLPSIVRVELKSKYNHYTFRADVSDRQRMVATGCHNCYTRPPPQELFGSVLFLCPSVMLCVYIQQHLLKRPLFSGQVMA